MSNIKISQSNVFLLPELNDYFLGETINLKSILEYKQKLHTESKSENQLFDFIDKKWTINKTYSLLEGVLSIISPTFSLMKKTQRQKYVDEFITYICGEFPILRQKRMINIVKYGINRKSMEEQLVNKRLVDETVIKYLCVRFGFNYVIINGGDKSFLEFIHFQNRPFVVFIKNEDKTYYINEPINSEQNKELRDKLKPNIELTNLTKLKVIELKEFAKKYGINTNGKKDDIITNITNFFN